MSEYEDQLLNIKQVAAIISCSVSTARRRRDDDPQFPKIIRIGGRLQRYRRRDVLDYNELKQDK